jgi:hypothetical protein
MFDKYMISWHRFYWSALDISQDYEKVWRSGRILECKSKDVGSLPGGGTVILRHSGFVEEVRHL